VYRTALQRANNKSVTIASIGETTNLQDLLRNEMDLVRAKVKKIVYMDGDFNFGCADGSYGPNDECWESAEYVVANMPSPDVEQIFQLHGDNHNGWWVGNDAKCSMDTSNPVKVAYSDMCQNAWSGVCDNYGRDSWDPNTVYVAIMGEVGGGQCNIGSGRACAYSVSDDGRTEYRDYNDHSKNMYDFSLVNDISCSPPAVRTSPEPSRAVATLSPSLRALVCRCGQRHRGLAVPSATLRRGCSGVDADGQPRARGPVQVQVRRRRLRDARARERSQGSVGQASR
jgi:hypothetical protein